MKTQQNAILLLSCEDQKGIVAKISRFIAEHNGNIINSDQHTDSVNNMFFMRIEWELKGFDIQMTEIAGVFNPIAKQFDMKWDLKFSQCIPRIAVFVSQYDHCLIDLLLRRKAGEFNVHISAIVSNHENSKKFAEQMGIPYFYFPMTKDNHDIQEEKQLALLEKQGIDYIVLARYMQILSKEFVKAYPDRIINIHHSFLPAFVGGKPYHQAFARGVKIIGATSHYVTEKLDQGPIIDQDVIRVSHRDSIEDMMRKGKDLEKLVLARAVRVHLENRVLVYGKKTVVFG